MGALKYLGVLVLLIGVVVIAYPALTQNASNTMLGVGLVMVIGGYLCHIILNRKIPDPARNQHPACNFADGTTVSYCFISN
jgi:drug/metabolite transporter (DMT)-like permease